MYTNYNYLSMVYKVSTGNRLHTNLYIYMGDNYGTYNTEFVLAVFNMDQNKRDKKRRNL